MALLLIDGFDHWNSGNHNKWLYNNFMSPSSGAARTGTQGLSGGIGGPYVFTKFYTTDGGIVCGFAFRSSLSSTGVIFSVRENNIVHLTLELSGSLGLSFGTVGPSGRTLTLKNGGGATLGTSVTQLIASCWYYIELKATIADAGSYELKIDGVTEASVTGSGDTRNGGAGTWDQVVMQSPTNSTQMEDFYLCDTSGPAPYNSFLGVCKVETLWPQTDAVAAGTYNTLTPSTAADHGALVDEANPNTTDYNGSATVDAKDSYQYPPSTAVNPILAVQVNPYMAKSDTSGQQVRPFLRLGTTDYDLPVTSLDTTYHFRSAVMGLNPVTGLAWTVADIATLQAGMKVLGA